MAGAGTADGDEGRLLSGLPSREKIRHFLEPAAVDLRACVLKWMGEIGMFQHLRIAVLRESFQFFHFLGPHHAVAQASNDLDTGTIRGEMIDRIIFL
jgi:hypothetical protein